MTRARPKVKKKTISFAKSAQLAISLRLLEYSIAIFVIVAFLFMIIIVRGWEHA